MRREERKPREGWRKGREEGEGEVEDR